MTASDFDIFNGDYVCLKTDQSTKGILRYTDGDRCFVEIAGKIEEFNFSEITLDRADGVGYLTMVVVALIVAIALTVVIW